MYFQNEDQNEDQETPPWRPEIRSQFLLTRTPPFLACNYVPISPN